MTLLCVHCSLFTGKRTKQKREINRVRGCRTGARALARQEELYEVNVNKEIRPITYVQIYEIDEYTTRHVSSIPIHSFAV